MHNSKKPVWMEPRDFVVPSLLVLVGLCCLIPAFAGLAADGQATGGGPKAMLLLISALFFGGAVFIVLRNYLQHKSWTYVHSYDVGLMVKFGGYKIGHEQLSFAVFKAFTGWEVVFGAAAWHALRNGLVWIEFKPMPVRLPNGERAEGYWEPKTRRIVVGYRRPMQELSDTALAHEIGHIMQYEATGGTSEKEHHERARALGLA